MMDGTRLELQVVITAEKPGIVTVPHPKKQIGRGLLNSILKQAKLKR